MNSFSLQRFEATHPGTLFPPDTPLCYIYYSFIFRRNYHISRRKWHSGRYSPPTTSPNREI